MPPITLDDLLTRSRTGDHAASDYLEDALLANVPTVGSRRVGGGPGGQAAYTNFYEGAQVAAGIPGAGSLIFEGSGAVIPPVRADKVICVLGPGEQAAAIGGPARMGISDLVLTPAGDQLAADTARRWARERVVEFELRTETVAPIPPDSRVAFFSTGAPPPKGLEVVVASTSLARREDLASDVVRAIGEKCDLFLTELKAAAIDVVAESAAQAGIAVEFVRNRPVAGGSNSDADLDEFLFNMYKEAAD
jgi:cyclic 2,3-diphosphoglycerate synthetase